MRKRRVLECGAPNDLNLRVGRWRLENLFVMAGFGPFYERVGARRFAPFGAWLLVGNHFGIASDTYLSDCREHCGAP